MLKRLFAILAMVMIVAAPVLGQAEAHRAPGFKSQLIPEAGGYEQAIATAIWTIVIFVIMLFILYPAWNVVLKGLKAREERIRKDISDAESARNKAEATLREYNAKLATAEKQVQEMIAKAVQQGEAAAQNINAQAQKDAEETRKRSQREIEAAGRQAVEDFKDRAAEISTEIAEKIIRRNLSAEDQRDLVNRSLEQLEVVNG